MPKSFAEEGDLLFIVENTRTPHIMGGPLPKDLIGGCNIIARVTEKLTWEMAKWEPILVEIDNPEAEYEVFTGSPPRSGIDRRFFRTTGIGFWTLTDKLNAKAFKNSKPYPSIFEDSPTTLFSNPTYIICSIENISRMSVEQILTHKIANRNFLPHLNKLLNLGLDLGDM